jgi:hypothetical protein
VKKGKGSSGGGGGGKKVSGGKKPSSPAKSITSATGSESEE